jgi:hypothetical protein
MLIDIMSANREVHKQGDVQVRVSSDLNETQRFANAAACRNRMRKRPTKLRGKHQKAKRYNCCEHNDLGSSGLHLCDCQNRGDSRVNRDQPVVQSRSKLRCPKSSSPD